MGTPPAGVPTAAARPARGGSRAARLVRSRQLAHSRARSALTSVAAAVLVLLFAAVLERVAFDGQVLPGISFQQGLRLADRIDATGRAIVWSGAHEVAELYWEQLRGHGLTMAPLER